MARNSQLTRPDLVLLSGPHMLALAKVFKGSVAVQCYPNAAELNAGLLAVLQERRRAVLLWSVEVLLDAGPAAPLSGRGGTRPAMQQVQRTPSDSRLS